MIATATTALPMGSADARPARTSRSAVDRFRADVIEGLSGPEKHIPSRYLYDATGDRLFQRIMASPDYYLTRCEAEIFRTNGSAMTRELAGNVERFEVIELGAGDGSKTKRLLRKWTSRGQRPLYRPVDISPHVLQLLAAALKEQCPRLQVESLQGEYSEALEQLPEGQEMHRVFLFLGSNIGNLDRKAAVMLLRKIAGRMNGDDRLLVGMDLKKDPRIIRRAYDDRAGITRQFNFNLLHRINVELGADLHLDRFSHEPVYDPMEGRALSYLVSKEDQEVRIPGGQAPVTLRAWEAIHVETSHKYDRTSIAALAKDAGLRVITTYTDRKDHFADVVMGRL